jgi:hypothetical protein
MLAGAQLVPVGMFRESMFPVIKEALDLPYTIRPQERREDRHLSYGEP